MAKKESHFDFSREGVAEILQYVRSELGDFDLHRALHHLYLSHQRRNTDHTKVVGQLITRLFHRLRCVLFLHTVLSQESVYIGVRSSDALIIARKVVAFCGKQVIRRGGLIEDYFLQSWHNFSYLMIGGIGLTNDCPQGDKGTNHRGRYLTIYSARLGCQ